MLRPYFGGTREGQLPGERMVAIHYTKDGSPISLIMDKQDHQVDNLRVLYLVIDAVLSKACTG